NTRRRSPRDAPSSPWPAAIQALVALPARTIVAGRGGEIGPDLLDRADALPGARPLGDREAERLAELEVLLAQRVDDEVPAPVLRGERGERGRLRGELRGELEVVREDEAGPVRRELDLLQPGGDLGPGLGLQHLADQRRE